MNPAVALAAISLIQLLITEGPKALHDIMVAWNKVDPTFEDFDALALLALEKINEKKTIKTT